MKVVVDAMGGDYATQAIVAGVVEAIRANTQTGEVSNPSTTTDRAVFIGGSLIFEIIDIAPLTNDVTDTPGIYMAVAKVDPTAEFSTASLLKSVNGQDFFALDMFLLESVMGFVPIAMDNGPVN